MKYISRVISESLTLDIPEKNVMNKSGVVEVVVVGTVTVRSYSVSYCRPVTSMNTFP